MILNPLIFTMKFNIRDNLKVTTNWSEDFKYQMGGLVTGGLVTTGMTLKNLARLSEEDLR